MHQPPRLKKARTGGQAHQHFNTHKARKQQERRAHTCMNPVGQTDARASLRHSRLAPSPQYDNLQPQLTAQMGVKRQTSGRAPTHTTPHTCTRHSRATRNRTTDCTNLNGARLTTGCKLPYAPLFRAVRVSARALGVATENFGVSSSQK